MGRDGNTEVGAENSVNDELFSISPGTAVDVHLARQNILDGFSSDLAAAHQQGSALLLWLAETADLIDRLACASYASDSLIFNRDLNRLCIDDFYCRR